MAASYPSQLNPGNLIQTTFVWNASEVNDLKVNPDLKRLLVSLYVNLNKISLAVNLKDSALYSLEEFLTGQQFFPNTTLNSTTSQSPTQRQSFRKVINFGTLPNAGATSVAHNITITSGYSFTRIYGTATNTAKTSFIPLPYASTTLNQNISLEITNTNVTITTGIDRTSYTTCYIIAEYIKQ